MEAKEQISYLREKILIHSYIYYWAGFSIITDHEFDNTAKELKKLVSDYPEEASQAEYANEFKAWDKDKCLSGYDLGYRQSEIKKKAELILEKYS